MKKSTSKNTLTTELEINTKIIGRDYEKQQLEKFFHSQEAEFLAVYGRRRVGKTFLIRNFFKNKECIFFQVSGILNAGVKTQLLEFKKAIEETFYSKLKGTSLETPKNWMHAFEMLNDAIKTFASSQKVVLFFDEFPWMAIRKKQLIQATDYYWNRHWSGMDNLRLIICGSAASWIIDNVLNNKGGLHNRVTLKLCIEPFNLKETQTYLKSRKINYDPPQILQLYMCIGGIPHYLKSVEAGLSAMQNVNRLCFQKNGLLLNEFNNLFSSLFKSSQMHETIIKFLASKPTGASRDQIEEKLSHKGGRLSGWLKELEHAGFICAFKPWGRERGSFYKVTDEYVLFYLNWIAPEKNDSIQKEINHSYWEQLSQTPSFKSWAGYAFEAICFKHLKEIRKALNIPEGATASTWQYRPKKDGETGAQIDLLFNRLDGVISLCEIKYSQEIFKMDKEIAQNIRNKIQVYQKITKTNQQIFISMITTFGVNDSMYKEELISSEATLKDLFL
jgi:AAA+ ATPase superfamily predicted ATPase